MCQNEAESPDGEKSANKPNEQKGADSHFAMAKRIVVRKSANKPNEQKEAGSHFDTPSFFVIHSLVSLTKVLICEKYVFRDVARFVPLSATPSVQYMTFSSISALQSS